MTLEHVPHCDLFIFAGEKSGDLHGGHLLQKLKELHPSLCIAGVGGEKMREAGLACVMPMEEFQVMGFIDVFLSLPKLFKQFTIIKRTILNMKPKMVVFIDYPGFNLRMAKALRKSNFCGKICHFICPSVWAYGKNRISLMENTLDLLLSILPFEQEYFQTTSLKVRYVGHPLVKAISYDKRENAREKLVGIFPGSRTKELARNLPIQLKAFSRLKKDHPNLRAAISVVHPQFLPMIKQHLENLNLVDHIQLVDGAHSYDLMRACTLAIAKSGTVTLELALHGVPTVVTYGISSIDLFIAQKILRINLPFYCLVNILAKGEVFPELIGPNLTLDALESHVRLLLENPEVYMSCRNQCEKIRSLLGEEDASQQAAKSIAQLLFGTQTTLLG